MPPNCTERCVACCVDDNVRCDTWLSPYPGIKTGAVNKSSSPRIETRAGAGDVETSNQDTLLNELHSETRRQLDDPDMSFQLLLPGEDYPLRQRTDALVNWCRGFLYGLGTAGFENFERLPTDTNEFLQDLIEITRTNFEGITASEQEEGAYAEIVEYVRIGTLLIREEIKHIDDGAPSDDSVLH